MYILKTESLKTSRRKLSLAELYFFSSVVGSHDHSGALLCLLIRNLTHSTMLMSKKLHQKQDVQHAAAVLFRFIQIIGGYKISRHGTVNPLDLILHIFFVTVTPFQSTFIEVVC